MTVSFKMFWIYIFWIDQKIRILWRVLKIRKIATTEFVLPHFACRGNAVHELERKPKSDIGLIIYFNTSCKKYIQSRDDGRSKNW